jgi:hypothetical protein
MNAKLSPSEGQWRCRVCDFDRHHKISVVRKSGSRYETSFYACSNCSTMFLNPYQFNRYAAENPNIEMPNILRIPRRR